jgi:tuftelin-interacting protein 11
MCRSIMPKLDIVLNEELVINPNRQAIEPFQWVMSWFELMPIDNFISLLERSFFPKWLQALHLWLNSTPDYNEVSKWYLGWKSLFNEKIVQHPSIKSKLSQGLMMMNRSVSGAPVSLPPQQQQQSIPTNKTNVISKTSHQDIVQSASMPSISSFKDLIERKAAENNILFVQVQNRFKEGKQVYRFGNLNVYIDRNVVFMLQNGSWIPASINEILQKAL